MSQQTVTQTGVFTSESKDAINENFDELYGTEVGGTLASAKILVGSAGNLATAVDMGGDATIDNTGAVDIAAGIDNHNVVTDGQGGSTRQVVAGSIALDGTNPTNIALPANFVATGYSLTLERSTAVSSGTAFVTAGAQSGANLPVYGWEWDDGSASSGTETVFYVVYGYID